MTTPPVGAYSRKATTVNAIQFDGTIDGLLAIFNIATNHADLVITIRFDHSGNVAVVSYGMTSATLTFGPSDWLVFPQDSPLPFVLHDAQFQADWAPKAP